VQTRRVRMRFELEPTSEKGTRATLAGARNFKVTPADVLPYSVDGRWIPLSLAAN